MLQLLSHLWGDYIFQNNWMATQKTKFTLEGWIACLIHCILYTLPFCFFVHSYIAIFVVFITHFVMDKFRLAKYICQVKNLEFKGINGFSDTTPIWLSTWLLIIVDNILHITINYLSIKYL